MEITQLAMERLTAEVLNMKEEIAGMKELQTDIYHALTGDKVSNSGGLIRRVENIEIRTDAEFGKIWEEIDEIKKENIRQDKENIKSTTLVKIMWAVAVTSLGGLAVEIIHLIFKNK